MKKSLEPEIGSTLYNPWIDWHEFRKEFHRSGELAELAGVGTDTPECVFSERRRFTVS